MAGQGPCREPNSFYHGRAGPRCVKIDIIQTGVWPSAMTDVVEEATQGLKAWVIKINQGEALAFLERTINSANSSGTQILVLRSDMVFGLDHIRSALYHAKRSFSEKRNTSDSLSMESLLYASGERQLSSAVKKMSVDNTTGEVVVARLSGGDLEVDSSWRPLGNRP